MPAIFLNRFPGQRDDETIQRLVGKHAIVYFPAILAAIFWGILAGVGIWAIFFAGWISSPGAANLAFAGLALVVAIGFLRVFLAIIDDMLDVIIVTDQRVINIVQTGLLKRNSIETSLREVLNVEGSLDGFFQTMFRYGRVKFHTASEKSDFTLEAVSAPSLIAREVMDIKRAKEMSDEIAIRGGEGGAVHENHAEIAAAAAAARREAAEFFEKKSAAPEAGDPAPAGDGSNFPAAEPTPGPAPAQNFQNPAADPAEIVRPAGGFADPVDLRRPTSE